MDKRNSPAATSVSVVWTLLLLAVTSTAAGQKFEIEIWCPTDIDIIANDIVDVFDLMVVSDSQGVCETTPCIGDVNGNGFVGALDLAYTMSYLGPCPRDGDVNWDGEVDEVDACLLQARIEEKLPANYCLVDIDDNGWVNHYDELAVSVSLTDDDDAEPRRADVDRNDSTDAADLAIVRGALGRDCRADLNRDGQIDELDQAELETLDCFAALDCVCL